MPKTIRRAIRRRRSTRRRSTIYRAPFQSNITGYVINIKNAGVTSISLPPNFLAPDLQVVNQSRQFKLQRLIVRFYPVVIADKTKPLQLSAQLLISDLATNTMVPATPIIPLSSTMPRTLVARNPGARWVSSNSGAGEAMAAIYLSSTQPTGAVAVDIISIFTLAPDILSPPPAATVASPVLEELPETLSITSPPPSNYSIPIRRR